MSDERIFWYYKDPINQLRRCSKPYFNNFPRALGGKIRRFHLFIIFFQITGTLVILLVECFAMLAPPEIHLSLSVQSSPVRESATCIRPNYSSSIPSIFLFSIVQYSINFLSSSLELSNTSNTYFSSSSSTSLSSSSTSSSSSSSFSIPILGSAASTKKRRS